MRRRPVTPFCRSATARPEVSGKTAFFPRNDRLSKKALVIAGRDSIPDYALFRQGSIERPAPLFKDSRRSYSSVVKTRFCPHAGGDAVSAGPPARGDAAPCGARLCRRRSIFSLNVLHFKPQGLSFYGKIRFSACSGPDGAGRRLASAFCKGTMIYRQKNESLDTPRSDN